MIARYRPAATILIGSLFAASSGMAAPTSDSHSNAKTENGAVERDNSAVNERDRSNETLTSENQGSSELARETTRKIREKLVADQNFSIYAKNIKVITTDDGRVTLRGPVRSEAEKQRVSSIATNVAGASSVVNKLEIAPG